MENYISTNEAKKRLACSAQTVRNLIKYGKLEAVQMENGRFLIDETSLQNYQQTEGREALVAKNAKQKQKVLQNVKPTSAENPGIQLAREIKEQWGARPEWLHLYQGVLQSGVNLNDIAFECFFRTPTGGVGLFCTISAHSLPDDPFLFEEELFFDWYTFDLDYEAAKNYLATKFRWWVQVTYQDKVIIRSCDDRLPIAGLREWVDDQEQARQDEQNILQVQAQKRDEEDVVSLVLFSGAVAFGLLLGLTSKSNTEYLCDGHSTL